MKKILIIIGALLILLIVGVWAYLFLYGAPQSASEVFTRFGAQGNDIDVLPMPETTIDVRNVEGRPERLKQLTLKPVAGAGFIGRGISYVEQGTGHIYHIDLDTGEETLISGTTIPKARRATFSTDGAHVAITAPTSAGLETNVGFIDGLGGKIDGVIKLPIGARDISFTDATSTFNYLLPSAQGSAGYSYDMEKGVGTEVFRIPLRDIRALWGRTIYVYTTPAATQKGYVYEVSGDSLSYVHPGGRGLMALSNSDNVVVSTFDEDGITSVAIREGGSSVLSLPLIAEKCVQNENQIGIFYCGIPSELSTQNFPDTWYMGMTSYSDSIVKIDIETNEWTLLADLLQESGREVDVSRIGADIYGEKIYFINKNDNTLWVFDTTL